MALQTVTGTVRTPDGLPIPDVVVTFEVWPLGTIVFDSAGKRIDGKAFAAAADVNGHWSIQLEQTDTTTPANIQYRGVESSAATGFRRTYTIGVPVGGGNVETLMQPAIGALPPLGVVTGPFTWLQGTAATVWTVLHRLGRDPVSVSVYDSGGNLVLGEVACVDPNTVRLTFASAFSGTAYIV